MTSHNLAAALTLAGHGIAVFPCAPDKKPRPGVRWRQEATADEARIRSWWRRWPDSLPAFEPGRHQLVVIDCDRHGQADGVAALEAMAGEQGEDHRDWPTVETPSTGRHVFFLQDGSFTNAKGALPAGIDVRGTGGYVIAEGATLPDGRAYQPLGDGLLSAMEHDAVPRLPDWLAALIHPPEEITQNPSAVMPLAAERPRKEIISGGGQSEFFRRTNEEALRRLGEWVPALFPSAKPQPGTGAYRVTSRELGRNLQEDLSLAPTGIMDFGVHDMGDARGGKRTAIDIVMEHGGAPGPIEAARWLCDQLGIDANAAWDAARPGDAVEIRLKVPPAVAEPEDAGQAEVAQSDEYEEAEPIDERLTQVGGVLGQVIDFIVATSRRPNRRLALAAALPLVGTLAGRRMATPTGAALQLYVIATYPTGGGKQHQMDAIDRLMRSISLDRHVGPSQFMSMSALVKHVAASPLSICAQDEFGALLKRLSHPRASTHEQGITMVMRSLWGANFSTVKTPAYATSSSIDIPVPAMSVFGPTTAAELYEALKGKDVVNGFLNRFLVLDGGQRVPEHQPSRALRDVPQSLKDAMAAIYRLGLKGRGNLSDSVCKNTAPDPDCVIVPWQNQEASDCYAELSRMIQQRMDLDPEAEPFLARTAEIALRCATIRACGDDVQAPTVTLEHMEWGAAIALQSADQLIANASRYMVDPLGAAEFERKIVTKLRTAGRGGLPLRSLHRSMQKHFRFAGDMKNALDALARSGLILVETRKVNGGQSTIVKLT